MARQRLDFKTHGCERCADPSVKCLDCAISDATATRLVLWSLSGACRIASWAETPSQRALRLFLVTRHSRFAADPAPWRAESMRIDGP